MRGSFHLRQHCFGHLSQGNSHDFTRSGWLINVITLHQMETGSHANEFQICLWCRCMEV
jgi:hypothetical protein